MTKQDIQIRWLIRRDMDDVLAIEQDCFDMPWTEEEFLICLRQRNCIGLVAEQGDLILGFTIYELHRTSLRILNLAVEPTYQRHGIGTMMINRLKDKLSFQRRDRLNTEVRETNLAAQLFFRDCKFFCDTVVPRFYENTDESAYLMNYSLYRRL